MHLHSFEKSLASTAFHYHDYMNSLNKVQLIGNVTAVPEIRETPSGQKVATFSLATNRSWKDATGVKQDQAEYHNIVVWGNLAGIVESYVTKGKKIYAEGRLQTRSWEDQAGQKKYKTEIVCESLILLSSGGEKTEGYDSPSSSASDGSAAYTQRSNPKIEEEIHIDDIPF